jgi:N-acetylneuraminic acid mutarotase
MSVRFASARFASARNCRPGRCGAIVALVLVLGSGTGFATPPIRFNYQTRLTDASGSPLQGGHTLFVGVWEGGTAGAANSGTLKYSESAVVTLSDGVASHAVGSGTPLSGSLTESVFQTDNDLFLQVAVDTAGNVVLPRTRLEFAPLAVRSITADSAVAGNGLPSGFLALSSSSAPQAGFTFTGQILPMNWQARRPMALGGRVELGAAAFDGKIYAIGGNDGSNSNINEQFDPQLDAWTTKAVLPLARYGLTCTELGGLIYAVGGLINGATVVPNNDAYDPAGDSWSPKQQLTVQRYAHSAAAVGGSLYVFGGWISGLATTNSVEAYNPGTNSWSFKAPMPDANAWAGAAALNGKIYIVGGSPTTRNLEYDPALNTYALRAPVPAPVSQAAVLASNGRLFVCGNSYGQETWIYDPATDSWSLGPLLAVQRSGAAGAVVNGKMYLIGGSEPAMSVRNEMLDGAMYFVHSKD